MGATKVGVSFVALALVAATGCAKGEPLTAAAIDAAEARWREAPLAGYHMRLEISGDRIEEGDFVVEVRDRKIASVTRNGTSIATRDDFYSVEGMFAMLRKELEMAGQPQIYWQPPKDARIYQRAQFDTKSGYCRRYLRSVTGTQHNIVITVADLEAL